MASEAPEDGEQRLILSTEEDDTPKKRVICCLHGEPCQKGKNEAALYEAKKAIRICKPKGETLVLVEQKRVEKTVRAIQKALQEAEIQKLLKEKNARLEEMKKAAEEVAVKSSRKESKRRRKKERKNKNQENSDTTSAASEKSQKSSKKDRKASEKKQKEEPFETLENLTKVVKEMKNPPSKRLFLGIMGWEQAQKTLTDQGKRIGIYYKMEKIRSIDVLEQCLPRFVVFCPHGSNEFKHYRIVERMYNNDKEFIVEDEGTAEVFRTLDQVARHYEKISDGTRFSMPPH